MGKGEYRFTLVGIVGLVALVAVLILIKGFPSQEENLVGQTSYWRPPTFTLAEGDAERIGDVDVKAIAIFPPDHTGKPSAVFTINGEWTGRLYPETSFIASSQIALTVIAVGETVEFSLLETMKAPLTLPSYRDALFAGESRGLSAGEGIYLIELSAIDSGRKAHLRIDDAEYALGPGDSAYLVGATITVTDTALRGTKPGMASYFLTPASAACGNTDGQTASCRGSRACCDGICQALPDCTSKPNGPVNTCGARQLYCCYGHLALFKCPVIADDSGFGPAPPTVEEPTQPTSEAQQ